MEALKNGKKIKCSIDVSNVGDYNGKEVVELYIHDVAGTYMRPYRELKDYRKVMLRVGETKRITFELGYDDLGYYMPDGAYVVEKGTIEILIGPDCLAKEKIILHVTEGV